MIPRPVPRPIRCGAVATVAAMMALAGPPAGSTPGVVRAATAAPATAVSTTAASAVAAVAADGTVVVDTSRVLQPNFLGVGVQWDPADALTPTYTTEQWNRITSRVDYLAPKFARVMIDTSSYVTGTDGSGNFVYNWNSGQMQRLYRILDYTQARGVTVMFGEWNKPAQATSYSDPRWLKAITDCLYQLRTVRGYTTIRYYNFVNEPNGSWMIPSDNWNQWYAGVTALYNRFSSLGYLSWITIVGPDSAFADDWVNATVDQIPHIMSQYEFHIYPTDIAQITSGSIESQVRMRRDYVSGHDPAGPGKYLFLGEIGNKVGITDYDLDQQNRVYDYAYGVEMADICIQAIRGAAAGMVPWDLDDSMHYTQGQVKRWGYWNSIGGMTVNGYSYPASDVNLRPWFYPMSTLSRLFPQGASTVYAGPSGVEGVRTAAAVIPAGAGRGDLSVALVNVQATSRTVELRVPAVPGTVSLVEYLYSSTDRPVDGNGFPVPRTTLTGVGLGSGVTVTVPGNAAVFLTTRGTGTAPALAGNGGFALTDELSDFSRTSARTGGWRIDASNPAYFQGDTGRATRTSDTGQSLTYAVAGASHVTIETSYWNAISGRLTLSASPDGVAWSAVPLKWDTAVSAEANWYTQNFESTSLPAGTNQVRVALANDPNVWTPQIDQVKILSSPGGGGDANLALGRPAWASSVEPGANLPAGNAVDGNAGSRWGSAWNDPQWIYMDLGAPHQVNRVVLRWEAAYARQYQIQTSTDGSTWTTVHSNYAGAGGTETATFAGTTARYVKMYGWQRATSYGYSLWEFEVYSG